MIAKIFPLLICLSLCIGCNSSKGSKGYRYSAEDVIEMERGACFGTCPVYDFKIDGLGRATFNGKTFVKLEGAFEKQFTAEETNELFDAFKKSDFWSYENEYTAPVTDLPTTWLSFYFMDRSKKIRCYYDIPVRLVNLIHDVEELALSSGGWIDPDAPDK